MLLGIASGDWMPPSKAPDGKEHWGGSGWARLGQFVTRLPMATAVGVLVWNRTHFSIQDHTGEMYDPDVVLMQRLMHKGIADNIVAAKAYGQKIINDVDDWYWGLSTDNYAYHVNNPKNNLLENINHYKATLAKSDLLICSTPYLAMRMDDMLNTRTEVSLNTIDLSRFTVKEHTDSDVPVVGWVGSTLHRSKDIETMNGILPPMVHDGKIKLYHGGHIANAPSFASKLGMKNSEVETAPVCTAEHYPKLLTMDIGIVPLSNIPFNRAKSDIKGLEYAASGIPFIAQNLDSYMDLYFTLGVGRIAKKPIKWIRHIEELRNPHIRAEEGAFNREAISVRDIQHGCDRLVDIITNL